MTTPTERDDRRPYDLVIVGAGPAGSSLALRLARLGRRVALVDQARFPRAKLCGEFLSPEAWPVLDRLGLSGAVARMGFHPIRRLRLSTPRGRVVEAAFEGPDGLPGIGLSRSSLDAMLVQQARDAGADVIERARVGHPIIEGGRVVGVRGRSLDGAEVEVRATVTVAADGRNSGLVRRTGTTRPRSRFRPRLVGLKRHLDATDREAEPPDTVSLHLVPGGYGGTCRVEASWINLCALFPESALRRHRGDLDRLAGDQFGRNPFLSQLWASSRPEGDWKAVAGVRVQASRPTVPGIFYVGDGQGTIDPLGGQGMTMALLGPEVLLPFLDQSLADGGAGPSLQAAYVAAWHARFDRRIRLCRAFHHALVRPRLIDLAADFRSLAARLLVACFRQTRDLT